MVCAFCLKPRLAAPGLCACRPPAHPGASARATTPAGRPPRPPRTHYFVDYSRHRLARPGDYRPGQRLLAGAGRVLRYLVRLWREAPES